MWIKGKKLITGHKVWKQIIEWKKGEDRAQGLLYLKQHCKAFAIPILTANH